MRDYEYWDRVLNELYSSMNSSMYLLRHFDRSTDSEEDNLFRENRRNKRLRNKSEYSNKVCSPNGMAYWLSMFTTPSIL